MKKAGPGAAASREREREREREEHWREEMPRRQGEWFPEANLFFFSLRCISPCVAYGVWVRGMVREM